MITSVKGPIIFIIYPSGGQYITPDGSLRGELSIPFTANTQWETTRGLPSKNPSRCSMPIIDEWTLAGTIQDGPLAKGHIQGLIW